MPSEKLLWAIPLRIGQWDLIDASLAHCAREANFASAAPTVEGLCKRQARLRMAEIRDEIDASVSLTEAKKP